MQGANKHSIGREELSHWSKPWCTVQASTQRGELEACHQACSSGRSHEKLLYSKLHGHPLCKLTFIHAAAVLLK